VLNCVGESYSRIQVCARDWPECQNESHQCRASRDSIRKQGNSHVPSRQPFAHDARADHGGNKEGGTKEFR